jgi:SAM-dependent methyltransferase
MSAQSFYRAFEDRYRGSRAIIKDRLRAYAGFLAPLAALYLPGAALDLGCGRGEWLELLGESGFDAQGVDLDEGMLAACHERGLAARHGDALAALRALPDDSLALVSAFHLVEHIPFDLVQELIREARRVLQPGGLLIMETPNPENLTVGATSFYLDPSHLHPLPPGLLGFATEHAGFARQRIVRLQEDAALHGTGPVGLITVLEGVSPDYSVVAQKAAPEPVLARFDTAFAVQHGVTLGQLAHRYEEQLARQHAEIHQILGRAEANGVQLAEALARTDAGLVSANVAHAKVLAELSQAQVEHARALAELSQVRVEQAQALAAQAQTRAEMAQARAELAQAHGGLAQLNHHAAQQDARLAHVEAHAAAMSQKVVDLLSSTSWRITSPLRGAMTLAYRLRDAIREGRIGSAIKWRVRPLVKRAGGAVLRRPKAKRIARALLRRMPGLEARLYALMLDNTGAARLVLDEEPGELSPRAARIFRELQQLRHTHALHQEQTGKTDAHSH